MIDAHAPLKRCSRKRKKLVAKPWISKGVFNSDRSKYTFSSIRKYTFSSIRNKQQLYKSHYLNVRTINDVQIY